MKKRLAIFSTHPIQYYTPLYRELAKRESIDLTVYYSFNNSAVNQANAGFGIGFEWDIPLLEGYHSQFLENVAETPSSQSYYGCDTPKVKDIIAIEKFNSVMVHGWYTKSYRQTIAACKKNQTPVFVRGDSTLASNYSWLKSIVKKFTHKRIVSLFDAYLVVGERSRQYYEEYGASRDKMILSPHFVDNQYFEAGSKNLNPESSLRTKYNIPTDAIVFLFCGKFISIKRPFDFVKAISIVSKQHQNVYGVMVGDGPMKGEIEELIAAENAPISLAGFHNQSAMPSVYASSDVLVLCSESETWGLVVNEAMACGRPAIVSSTVGCSPDLILPEQTGYEFPKGRTDLLAEKMSKFVLQTGLHKSMGLNAHHHIQKFSAAAAADGICEAVERFGI